MGCEEGVHFEFCDCNHTPPKELIKIVDSNDTEPAEPNCTEICKETSEGFPFCDCQHTPPLKLVTLKFIKNAKENNGTDPEEPDCDELCKTTSDGFPFCDCGGSHGNLKEQESIEIATEDPWTCEEICKTGDGFPFCDCNPIPPKKAK